MYGVTLMKITIGELVLSLFLIDTKILSSYWKNIRFHGYF